MVAERRKRAGVMLAYPFDVKRLRRWPKPWYTQPKINGERCRAVIAENGTVNLFSSTGLSITSVPHINSALTTISGPITLDGELYRHGWRLQTIHSVVSRKLSPHPDHSAIRFFCFDIIDDTQTQAERTRQLLDLGIDDDPIVVVPTHQITSTVHLLSTFDYYIDEGYEGIIVRHPNQVYLPRKTPYMMKMKNFHKGTFKVVGYEEERDKHRHPKGTLGSVVVKLPSGITSSVGTGFTYEERVDLWLSRDTLIGKRVHVHYQELTSDGRLAMSSFKGFVE